MKIPNDIELYRIRDGVLKSDETYGNNGAFIIPIGSFDLKVIISDGQNWDHVSVSLPNRTPSWNEMCQIKDIFFEDNETVIQYHPAKAQYVNTHPHCLHLWRPQKENIPVPDILLV